MAGIGFELRKLMAEDKLFGSVRAYGYASLISAGPWIFSILGILLLGFLTLARVSNHFEVTQFQTSLTNLIASSLIFSGILQLAFTRYVADQSFLQHDDYIMPNFNGALLVMSGLSGLFAFIVIVTTFHQLSIIYCFLMEGTFILLCCVWMSITLLMGLKKYKTILAIFFMAYGTAVVVGYALSYLGLNGLLFGFFIGHVLLLLTILITIYRNYPSDHSVSFHFLKRGSIYISLVMIGVIYNLAVWADKYIFWFHPFTGHQVIGPFRISVIYDLPIFLAYLSLIPGMSIFLLRVETDFMDYYKSFYDAICNGGTLLRIHEMHEHMVAAGRKAIVDIAKVQGATILVVFVAAPPVLQLLGISMMHLHLLYIDTVGVGLQLVFMALLNLLFYLDKRHYALILAVMFFLLNTIFSLISIYLGPSYYGYGFAGSLLIVVITGTVLLNNAFDTLEYKTFMLQ